MLLAADIGNTNIKLGVFKDGEIIKSWILASALNRTSDELGLIIKNLLADAHIQNKVKHAVISSVVSPLTECAQEACIKYLGAVPLIISHKIKMNIKLKLDNAEQTGADRIANAAAAAYLYSAPSVTVDLGTAASFDVVNADKEFIGGLITAGMKLQLDALSSRTSKLPKLNIEAPAKVIGANTIDAMISGTVRGHASMIDALTDECCKELGAKAFIIGTGGCARFISRYMKRGFDVINPDLTLIGMKILYEMNR